MCLDSKLKSGYGLFLGGRDYDGDVLQIKPFDDVSGSYQSARMCLLMVSGLAHCSGLINPY